MKFETRPIIQIIMHRIMHIMIRSIAHENRSKLYYNEARHRIVYTVVDEKIEVTAVGEVLKESLEILGIGERDRQAIYNIISNRIN